MMSIRLRELQNGWTHLRQLLSWKNKLGRKRIDLGFAKHRISATDFLDFTDKFNPATCPFEKQREMVVEEREDGKTIIRELIT